MSKRIKTAKHTTKFSNIGKRDVLSLFLTEYTNGVKFYVDYLWENEISWNTTKGIQTLDIKNKKFNIPNFISTADIYPFDTKLSARALKLACGQAIGTISSVISKRNKLDFKLNLSVLKGDVKSTEKLLERISVIESAKPKIEKIVNANIDSNCCEFITKNVNDIDFVEFDGFLKLKSIGKLFGTIEIPVKFHRQTNKLSKNGFVLKTSWIISKNELISIWEAEETPKKESGRKVGADQGVTTCLTLSDGQITGKDKHGHDLTSIMTTLSKKKKGSKSFKKTQTHRKNHINWAINQLNLSDIKEIGYEDVKNIRYGKNTSNFMKGWTFTEIRTAIENRCEEEGVLLTKQGSIYRSQRCSGCGYVHKGNRKKKIFACLECGHTLDADLNGAMNHEANIDKIPFELMNLKLNKKGFYWLESGLFDLDGQEITVPDAKKT